MSTLFSTNYSSRTFNLAMLLLRIGLGGLLLPHGYDKLVHFSEYSGKFINFLGLGNEVSLGLTIFGEFFCSILIILGLFTRLAAIPPIIVMCVALFKAHKGLIFSEGEHAGLYLVGFIVLMLLGPGKMSVDGMIRK